MTGIISPMFPPMSPFVLPPDPFNTMIENYGVRLQWMKSHQCPCQWGGSVAGSPEPNCKTCAGRGVFWDAPSSIFSGLITQMHRTPSPDEVGFKVSKTMGWEQDTQPVLTIPSSETTIWTNAAAYDAFIELDAVTRYKSELIVGEKENVPYGNSLSIPLSGAVSVWNAQTLQIKYVSSYAVSGSTVTISGYPDGTYYTVEYIAAPVYIAFREAGGLPHIRPFSNGAINLPRRFHLSMLDIWLRSTGSGIISPNNP